jgi:putative thiazole/oxazole-modified microcin (TOMM)-like peptide
MAESIYVLGDEDRRKFAKIVANVWTDESFAQRYANSPHEVLAEHGIDYPTSVQAPLVPPKPEGDLNLEALEAVAAGAEGTAGTAGSISSVSSIGATAFTAACAGTYGSHVIDPVLEA